MAIAGNLQAGILQAVKARQSRRYPHGTETYDFFLRGRYFLNKRYSGGLQRSTDFFRQCIARDGNYALAHVGMADAFNFLGLHGFMPPNDAFPLAKASALKALALDDELGEAHASLGWTTCFYDWDQATAELKYRQAIGLDPGYAAAREWYALFLAMMGRFDEALIEIAVGLELDPLSLIINSIRGLIHVFSRDYDNARKSLEKTLELDPDFLLALIWLGESYTYTGMPGQAVELLERAVEVDPEMSYALAALGYALARAGNAKKAQAVLERMEAMAQKRYVSKVQLAQVRVGLGDTEGAFALYDEALGYRDPFFLWFKVAPQFDGIRSDPRFRRFLEKTGLAH